MVHVINGDLNNLENKNKTVIICEGFSTGASLAKASKKPSLLPLTKVI